MKDVLLQLQQYFLNWGSKTYTIERRKNLCILRNTIFIVLPNCVCSINKRVLDGLDNYLSTTSYRTISILERNLCHVTLTQVTLGRLVEKSLEVGGRNIQGVEHCEQGLDSDQRRTSVCDTKRTSTVCNGIILKQMT